MTGVGGREPGVGGPSLRTQDSGLRTTEGGLLAPRGWRVASGRAHIKGSTGDKLDLGLLVSERDCVSAGVFTRNQVRAAPVRWCERLLPSSRLRAIAVNSGNANACTGEQGMRDTSRMADLAASMLKIQPDQVLVASTGVIGIPMPMDRIEAGIKALTLGDDAGAFNDAMMTTDTKRKQHAVEFDVGGVTVRVGGITKGAAMIHPNMATMLCFLTSDAAVDPAVLPEAIHHAAERSFNMLSVDGDTSTNDTFVVMCNGAAGNTPIRPGTDEAARLAEAIEAVALSLARQMAQDSEGATKTIEVRVTGAASEREARAAARAVSSSTLLKCAVHGNDPNWGRILMALGNTDVELEESRIRVSLNGMGLVAGGVSTGFDPAAASKAMDVSEVVIELDLGLGDGSAIALGCDMTEEYVTLNADYTT